MSVHIFLIRIYNINDTTFLIINIIFIPFYVFQIAKQ